MDKKNLNKYIDHTLLKPEAKITEIEKLCQEALKYKFATVCVNGYWTKTASEFLKNSEVGVTTVIGFPLGANSTKVKVFEAQQAIIDGTTEIDMVMNIGALKAKDYETVLNDMKAVKLAAGKIVVKCILENCLLTKEEIVKACELAIEAKLDFVKTSTGFSKEGAKLEDVKLMFSIVKDKLLVKAAGGVKNSVDALEMLEAGAARLGTSGGVLIMEGLENFSSGY